ncbi:protein asteroid [Ischnura elegans]|uniref:protein asteroid n=1 Tax=Ischnura elegans TaxID=197161 RepID=UPI001ED86C7D|nr:protein asteroid [Ischnura elegans]
MGIRGLTTFIAQNHDRSFVPYRLHNCNLVIDGNSVACQLYVREFGRNKSNHSAFGGDYDVYARVVKRFFTLLSCCEIKAIVIFDGGKEPRKSSTSVARFKDKIVTAIRMRPDSCSECCMPLLMLEVFKCVAVRSGAVVGMCDFEADEEIAALGRALSCPILSFDSDFYIHAVPAYIPFPTLATELTEESCSSKESSSSKSILRYLECSSFSVEKFLSICDSGDWRKKSRGMRGILQVEVLPLIAAVLGNDYVKPKTFQHFISQLPLPKSKSKNHRQRVIVGLLEWLRFEESLETAIEKILNHTKKGQRNQLKEIIQDTVNVYVGFPSQLVSQLNLSPTFPSETQSFSKGEATSTQGLGYMLHTDGQHQENEKVYPLEAPTGLVSDEKKGLNELSSASDSGNNVHCSTEEESDSDENDSDGMIESYDLEQDADWNEKRNQLPEWFLENHRKGKFPPSFMDILMQRIYICSPQVEDRSRTHSHAISFPILSVIVRLLTPTLETPLFCWARVNQHAASLKLDPLPKDSSLPKSEDLWRTPVCKRVQILLQSLNLMDEHEGLNLARKSALESLPSDWRLLALSLAYWRRNSSLHGDDECFLVAACFVIVVLRVIDMRSGPPGRNARKVRREKDKPLKRGTTKLSETEPLEVTGEISNDQAENDWATCDGLKTVTSMCKEPFERSEATVESNHKSVKQLLQLVSTTDCVNVTSSNGRLNQLRHMDEDNGRAYFLSGHKSGHKRPRPFNVTTVHCFSELQSVIMHVGHLNSLLGDPFVSNTPHTSFSGTIAYNAYSEIKSKACRGLANKSIWETLLGTSAPTVENLMNVFLKCILTISWGKDDIEPLVEKKKRRKRNRKKATSEIASDVSVSADEKLERTAYDPENKFSLLNLIEINR